VVVVGKRLEQQNTETVELFRAPRFSTAIIIFIIIIIISCHATKLAWQLIFDFGNSARYRLGVCLSVCLQQHGKYVMLCITLLLLLLCYYGKLIGNNMICSVVPF